MRFHFLLVIVFMTNVALAQNAPRSMPGQDFVKALSFAQHFATPAALSASNDHHLKTTILQAMKEEEPTVSFAEVDEIFDKQEFARFAGADQLTVRQMQQLLDDNVPAARKELLAAVRAQADLLTTQFDMIDEPHQRTADELAGWIAKNYAADQPLNVSVICTGNSRRSMLGATMGNIAAAYWGLPNLKFHSGGTSPSAFNSRTIKALQQIGVEVTATGEEAPRGKAGDPNPIYQVRWGDRLQMPEFSKLYSHERNPQKDFAAILVCDEAEEACPTVAGASIRIAAPYFDPKAFDGTPLEGAKYAERRDDIGRMMLSALMQARRRVSLRPQ